MEQNSCRTESHTCRQKTARILFNDFQRNIAVSLGFFTRFGFNSVSIRLVRKISTRMHGSTLLKKRPYIILWYGIFFINSYSFAVVKYLYIVLKHFGRSLMLFASICFFFFYHVILLKIIYMQPYKDGALQIKLHVL